MSELLGKEIENVARTMDESNNADVAMVTTGILSGMNERLLWHEIRSEVKQQYIQHVQHDSDEVKAERTLTAQR